MADRGTIMIYYIYINIMYECVYVLQINSTYHTHVQCSYVKRAINNFVQGYFVCYI